MAEHIVGWQHERRVCVASFGSPDPVGSFKEWKAEHRDDFGPSAKWIVNFGRITGGGTWTSVWVLRQHLPPDFAISDKHLGR